MVPGSEWSSWVLVLASMLLTTPSRPVVWPSVSMCSRESMPVMTEVISFSLSTDRD